MGLVLKKCPVSRPEVVKAANSKLLGTKILELPKPFRLFMERHIHILYIHGGKLDFISMKC